MRVLHAVPSIGDTFGGVAAAVASLGPVEHALGRRPTLLTLDRPEQGAALRPVLDRWYDVVVVPPGPLAGRYHGGRAVSAAVRDLVPGHDLLVLHSTFDFLSQQAHRVARAGGVPYLLWSHGSLDPYDLAKHRWAKRALGPLWRSVVGGAAAVVCTTEEEAARLHTFGAPARRRVVPLAHEPAADRVERAAARLRLGIPSGTRVTAFLGRVDPKKGLPRLLEAFTAVRGPDDLLLVAGDGDPGYARRVRTWATRLGLGDQVRFLGWVSGADKVDVLAAADVFALVSDNENFGLAAVEALAAGTAVMVSDEVYLGPELAAAGAAVVTGRATGEVAGHLRRLLDDPSLRGELGAAAAAYVRSALAPQVVARRYDEVVGSACR